VVNASATESRVAFPAQLSDYHPFRYMGRVIMVQLMGWSLGVLMMMSCLGSLVRPLPLGGWFCHDGHIDASGTHLLATRHFGSRI
jgi:hypothetical protein